MVRSLENICNSVAASRCIATAMLVRVVSFTHVGLREGLHTCLPYERNEVFTGKVAPQAEHSFIHFIKHSC